MSCLCRQVPTALGDASEPAAALAGGGACLAACLGYCGYQVAFPELQRRRIAAAQRKRRASQTLDTPVNRDMLSPLLQRSICIM